MTALGCQEQSSGAAGGSRYFWGSKPQQPDPALQSLVEGKALEKTGFVDQIRPFYRGVNYQLIWFDGERPSKRHGELAKAIEAADDHGLPAHLYPIQIADSRPAAERDVHVSTTFFRYFSHLSGGRLDPRQVAPLWTLRPEKPDLVVALTEAVNNNNLGESARRLEPALPEYGELQKALARYRAIAAKGGWPATGGVSRLKPGEQSPAVPSVRQRLAIEGDLEASLAKDQSPIFDAPLADAVKRFEERHRLKADGVLDAETVAAMNIPVETRIRAIELNLERLRWLPDQMPARYLVVNVPDYRLEAIENGRVVMSMRVIVGAADNKTPIFADEMTHVIFSPYWNVPPGIARNETIPRVMNDPGFLARNNMEVVGPSGQVVDPDSVDWSNPAGLRIRQRPGSSNALGGVKFVFPNNFDVYLHDTNAAALFNRLERALSHGCVRVEEPEALAQYVLRDFPEWTPETIRQAMDSGREKHVKLKTPIPVYILYKTAWVHEGGVRFLKDLYGYDADHAAKLWPATH